MKKREINVLELLQDKTNNYASRVALGMKSGYGWKEFTYNGLGLTARKLASYLVNDLQLKKEDKLAILSESKPEYGACVFASVIAGLITVPLDIKLTKSELLSILSSCQPTVILVSQHYLDMALALQKELPCLKYIIVMDEISYNPAITSLYSIPNNYNYKWKHRSKNSTCFIIYTSGTTGAPKGVEITFGNMLAQINDMQFAMERILPMKDVRILSILPMNHLFEMTVGFSLFLNMGYSVYYTQSLKPKDVLGIMQDKNIHFMILVPAFLKLLKMTIENDIKNETKFYQFIFNLMYKIAKFIPFVTIRKLMFRKINRKFGENFLGCLSGGAPLDIAVAKFFERIGFEIYEGYGLSETSPVISLNVDRYRDIKSVGAPLKSFESKIDKETGELLVKGPCIMKGYYNQPDLTAQVIDKDGWLHTGDIGELKNGRLYITGRIKNMIVLSGGKKVFPEEVEQVLFKSDMFAEVCVLGSERTFGAKEGAEDIVAVIVPKQHVIEQCSNDEELNKLVKKEVKQYCVHLAPYKHPMNIIVTKESLPRTATNKVKRKEVKEKFLAAK